MSKSASGSEMYFDVLRSMNPSDRLKSAIVKAERVSVAHAKQQRAAHVRAVKKSTAQKKRSRSASAGRFVSKATAAKKGSGKRS